MVGDCSVLSMSGQEAVFSVDVPVYFKVEPHVHILSSVENLDGQRLERDGIQIRLENNHCQSLVTMRFSGQLSLICCLVQHVLVCQSKLYFYFSLLIS